MDSTVINIGRFAIEVLITSTFINDELVILKKAKVLARKVLFVSK